MKHAHKVDMSFKYTSANDTDIRKTFARIRREQKAAEAAKKPAANVKPLKKKEAQ